MGPGTQTGSRHPRCLQTAHLIEPTRSDAGRQLRGPARSSDAAVGYQCECGRPVPQRPHEWGVPLHEGASPPPAPATLEANTESFLASFVEPQRGHAVPSQFVDRTRISLSSPQVAQ